MNLYVIVNSSLRMSAGKIASQVGHAVLEAVRITNRNKLGQINYRRWLQCGEPIVVLKAPQDRLTQIINSNSSICLPIRDAGRTQVEPGSLTAVGCRIIDKEYVPTIIKELKLL